ncbi:MAG: hypothetical protein WCX32_00225 [Clostridia bacterium]|nr:hypothetical protein [Clostridia bacterium]
MTFIMLIYPIIMLLATTILLPALLEDIESATSLKSTIVVIIIVFAGLGAFIGGALLAFLLLDHKDEHIFDSISVTSVSVSGYIKFKMVYVYILSVISTLVLIWGTQIFAGEQYIVNVGGVIFNPFSGLTALKTIMYAIVMNLYMPVLGLFIATKAKNKIEGFAYLKASALLVAVPVLLLVAPFRLGWQYFLGVLPNFWASKALLTAVYPSLSDGFPFIVAILIGAIYNIVLIRLLYKNFLKSIQ